MAVCCNSECICFCQSLWPEARSAIPPTRVKIVIIKDDLSCCLFITAPDHIYLYYRIISSCLVLDNTPSRNALDPYHIRNKFLENAVDFARPSSSVVKVFCLIPNRAMHVACVTHALWFLG